MFDHIWNPGLAPLTLKILCFSAKPSLTVKHRSHVWFKACKVNLNYTQEICDNIYSHADIQARFHQCLFNKLSERQSSTKRTHRGIKQLIVYSPGGDPEVCERDPSVQWHAAECSRYCLYPLRWTPHWHLWKKTTDNISFSWILSSEPGLPHQCLLVLWTKSKAYPWWQLCNPC